MYRGFRLLGLILLSAAITAPLANAKPLAAMQDRDDRDRDHRRVYDPDHHDYHDWDSREDEAYRRWLEERHHVYVDYERLKHKEQREYWNWRHQHEEHEEREHH
jgi:inorganic pyrophosphatase